MIFYEILKSEITIAARNIVLDLLNNKEHFYYITLVTSGLANTPCISAWSLEALERKCGNDKEEAEMLKWSYADSPYCCWKQEYFDKVSKLLCDRGNIWGLDDIEFEKEYNLRLFAMEEAMKELDKEGIFALNQDRKNIIVLVEVMPPDGTNTQRAYRMNNSNTEIFNQWITEAAEDIE